MKHLFRISIFLMAWFTQAQTALYNSGNLRIHENGQIGFHTDLINDGIFDENQGLAGFYSENTLDIQGSISPTFFDVEFATQLFAVLRTTVNLTNNANFISGDVLTPRDDPNSTLNFIQDAFSAGEGDANKVDGYASITQKQVFTFPVGTTDALRPLILNSESSNEFARCAYFNEDPNSPSTFAQSFDTGQKPIDLGEISTTEFWRLEGSVPSTVQISWNEASNIAAITDDASVVVVVGWSKAAGQWVSLGSAEAVGDLDAGFATSLPFVPNDYEVITFGGAGQPLEVLDLDNYLVTPNGDGINDTLVIEELQASPNNTVQVFDRFGLKVFEKDNYTNEFNGLASTGNVVLGENEGLPSGVYFYVAKLHDLDLEFQGFLYLAPRP
ncbi:gliding motility-associated C-terminal domain-containing protein [Aggregatimonas sangjinii]|uniref:Gliding motility-associated C-terminal domain-containing protein n=1 Tax=Aggregatimonas sangjinii TaxID=2583587 RepID=A0A5B7SKS1_9FLAO|nr:gliding motility-associated C-terminal domain-containing protein [Aggregatimonas sangjinii]QCW99134.1 gliding motility-associated C-terminal domain-containing protein [Aggregatimonas sangjinii]